MNFLENSLLRLASKERYLFLSSSLIYSFGFGTICCLIASVVLRIYKFIDRGEILYSSFGLVASFFVLVFARAMFVRYKIHALEGRIKRLNSSILTAIFFCCSLLAISIGSFMRILDFLNDKVFVREVVYDSFFNALALFALFSLLSIVLRAAVAYYYVAIASLASAILIGRFAFWLSGVRGHNILFDIASIVLSGLYIGYKIEVLNDCYDRIGPSSPVSFIMGFEILFEFFVLLLRIILFKISRVRNSSNK